MEKKVKVKVSADTSAFKRQLEQAIDQLEDFKDTMDNVEDADFRNVSRQIGNVTNATRNATQAVEDTVNAINDLSSVNTRNAVNGLNNVQNAAQNIQNTAQNATSGVNNLSNSVNSVRSRTLQSVNRNLNNVNSSASNAASSANGLRSSLNRVTPGGVNSVTTAAGQAQQALDDAADAADELKDAAKSAIGAIAAAGTINEVVDQALDNAKIDTQIDISFNVDNTGKQAIKDVVYTLGSYEIESEEALEASRKQWALNKDATDEYNAAVMKSAATIVSTYGDIDLNELIQESNEIAKSFDITDQEALALIDHLLEIGFPTDQLDIITEYGSQLKRAGFDAQQIQGILASGADTGSWNVDVLLDGLKEARITMSEFGQGVDETTAKVLESANISSKQFQQWGKDIAAGGEKGAKAYQDLGAKIASIKDPVLQNQIGTMVYGTLWEENGTKITDTITNMNKYISDAGDNQDKLNEKTKQLDENPAIKMSQAISKLKEALLPVLSVVANVVSILADFISEHPKVAAAIAAIAAILTIVIGIVSALAPIITAACAVMATGFSIPLLPILAIVAAISAVIGIGVALYKNWDTIKSKAKKFTSELSDGWELFKSDFSRTMSELGQEFSQIPGQMKKIGADILNGIGEGIKSKLGSIASWCKEIKDKIVNGIKNLFGIHSPSTVMADEVGLNLITGIGQGIIDNIGKFFDMVGGIKDKVVGFFKDLFGKNESVPFENLDTTEAKELETVLNRLNKTAKVCQKNLSTIFVSCANIARSQFTNMSNIIKNQSSNARNEATSQFISLKKVIATQITEARNIVTSKMLSISKVINTQSQNAKNNAKTHFISLYNIINTQMSKSYSSVSSYMNKIANATNKTLNTKVNVTKSIKTIDTDASSLAALSANAFTSLNTMALSCCKLTYATANGSSGIGLSSVNSNNNTSQAMYFELPTYLDGKLVAKTTAKYMNNELTILDKKNSRKRGNK